MIVYRLSKKKYSRSLDGIGASLSGGRWNNKGTSVIYTSESRSLAALESLAHIDKSSLPEEYKMISIEIPESIDVYSIDPKVLPKNWENVPPLQQCMDFGDNLLKARKYCVLKFPSVVVRGESNYLINPKHTSFKLVSV